jgi:DNA-binding NtrC family response regulator
MASNRSNNAATVNQPPSAEGGIAGYVLDNMEGAVDQASFLAKLDIPIAIIGPHGTGKMYVAKIVHQESGRAADKIVPIDCRAFRNRDDAIRAIQRELKNSEGKTLVFKSPHLMSADAQIKLARQIASRTLADVSPPRYLPNVKLVALFPDTLEHLIVYGSLTEKLASVFAGYPIHVPPIKDRKQAVLRWADKILGQECEKRDKHFKGFTEDAEQAMLEHDWLGNISEMRQRIGQAMDVAEKEWITPVDLGIFKSKPAVELAAKPIPESFLETSDKPVPSEDTYTPTALEQLDVALGVAVNNMLESDELEPLGAWLVDSIVLAARERFHGSLRGTADFLHTNSRNISRWIPQIDQRTAARQSSITWGESRRLIGEWIKETSSSVQAPLEVSQNMLLSHLEKLAGKMRVASRAKVMDMSIPTYQKRVKSSDG